MQITFPEKTKWHFEGEVGNRAFLHDLEVLNPKMLVIGLDFLCFNLHKAKSWIDKLILEKKTGLNL